MIVNLVRRRKQTENEEVQQTDLCASVRLAFANHMDRLVAGNCAPSAPKRTGMLAGADQALGKRKGKPFRRRAANNSLKPGIVAGTGADDSAGPNDFFR